MIRGITAYDPRGLNVGIVIFLFLSFSTLAQERQDKEQAKQYMEQAEMIMTATNAMDDAREILVMAANMDTSNIEANFKAGYYHMLTIGKEKAATFLQQATSNQKCFKFVDEEEGEDMLSTVFERWK